MQLSMILVMSIAVYFLCVPEQFSVSLDGNFNLMCSALLRAPSPSVEMSQGLPKAILIFDLAVGREK